MKKLIKVKNITKSYKYSGKKNIILNKVSFHINSGQTLAIIGSSGIGKSTLLHILGCLDKPDSGELFYKEKNILTLGDTDLARFRNKTIGFIFQFHHLLNNFSALENTMMPALIGKVDKKTASIEAEKLLIRVGMQERMKYTPNQLSGGELQRVAIARALIQNPSILLADEPTGSLDKKNSDHIQNLLIQLNIEMKMTLVLVTHNKSLASCMSKQITISDKKIFTAN